MPDINDQQAPLEQSKAVCGACGGSGDSTQLARVGKWKYRRCSDCNGTGRIPAPVVPTPSQDAEGDGLAEAWRAIERVQGIGVGVLHRDRVERAIRAPYEELVTAAREYMRDHADAAEPDAECVCAWCTPFRDALTRIEESLGGRKDD